MKWMIVTLLAIGLHYFAHGQESEIFQKNGLAIEGYDPVAFFSEGGPTKGREELSYSWKGAKWLFSSQENLLKFKEDPAAFAPQYGGYCAFGMSRGYKAPTEINTWTVREKKLYLNYNMAVKQTWIKDPAVYIEKADVNWGKTKHKE
jgi:YHS domain-containing protein